MKPNILFLDVDGVLNCQVFYETKSWEERSILTHEQDNLCPSRIKWVNELCKDCNLKVVVSSTWRHGKTVEELQEMFNRVGGEFEVLDKTPDLHYSPLQAIEYLSVPRGSEIKYWLSNTLHSYANYVIVDDDGDMLLEQSSHFFQTDPYSGLTPTILQRITNFLTT